ncbi:MAG: HAMP domain-containing histidine kinase [Proteobacteria bacterium]|nr:HAMP domain-containing histidine kinase [Pseudomonadota bacterium]
MRRLSLQIYLAILAALALFVLLGALAWWGHGPEPGQRRLLAGLGRVATRVLPPAQAPAHVTQAALQRLQDDLQVDAAIWSADGERLAFVGPPLPGPPPQVGRRYWRRGRRGRVGVWLPLPDGRWLQLHAQPQRRGPPFGWPGRVALLGLAIALASYPVVRRLTRRLERLQRRVDELGAGDLGARVEVEGRDEVASLAQSFNRAAERIEALVETQRQTLATASHELRTPLTRIRMAIELLATDPRPELVARAERDVAELDELIGEILLASRLESRAQPPATDDVDLLALVAEEAARSGAEVRGEPTALRGDARLLRRLVRNLLDNATRHGGGGDVVAEVSALGPEAVRIAVHDRGPGVPAAERERIFEPFYRAPGSASDSGTGLGLALVQRIARHHGGEARCRARDGGGSTFEVDLPIRA